MLDASTKFREYWVSKFFTVLFTDRQTRTALVEVITVINWENVYARRRYQTTSCSIDSLLLHMNVPTTSK